MVEKVVKFVTDLVVKDVRFLGQFDISYEVSPEITIPVEDGWLTHMNKEDMWYRVEKFAPIHNFAIAKEDGSYDDIYIAYTEDVQQLLNLPLDVYQRELSTLSGKNSILKKDKEGLERDLAILEKENKGLKEEKVSLEEEKASLEEEVSAIKEANFWKRLKFLFTRKIL
jgi:hypothetical protein